MSLRRVANPLRIGGAVLALGCLAYAADTVHRTGTPIGWRQHELKRTRPPVIDPGPAHPSVPAPRDAVVLFDGTNLDGWQSASGGQADWTVADGAMTVKPGAGAIRTKKEFGDCQLHVEWASPKPVRGKGQDRGNSGIFFMGMFEVQVLDSYKADTYADGQAGAIYGQFPPIFNASLPPGEWQTYDIAFRRTRFDETGKLLEPARLTVIHNGVVVQNNEELLGQTNWLRYMPFEPGEKGPIELQDHSHPVKFRNMWLRELPGRPLPTPADLVRPAKISLTPAELEKYVGSYDLGSKGAIAKVAREGDHLTVTLPFRKFPLVAEPVAEHVFQLPFTDGRFTFKSDASGDIKTVEFQIADGQRTWTKK